MRSWRALLSPLHAVLRHASRQTSILSADCFALRLHSCPASPAGLAAARGCAVGGAGGSFSRALLPSSARLFGSSAAGRALGGLPAGGRPAGYVTAACQAVRGLQRAGGSVPPPPLPAGARGYANKVGRVKKKPPQVGGKMKLPSSFKERFRKTATGKYTRMRVGKRHCAFAKSHPQKMRLRNKALVPPGRAAIMRKLGFKGH